VRQMKGAVGSDEMIREAEGDMQLSAEFCRMVIDLSENGIVILDADGRIIGANRAFAAAIGDDADAIAGKRCIHDFLGEEDGALVSDLLERVRNTAGPDLPDMTVTLRGSQGGGRPFRIHAHPSSCSAQVLLIFSDTNEDQRADKFLEMADNTGVVAYKYQLQPRPGVVWINAAIARMTGYTPEECVNDPDFLEKFVHRGDRPLLKSIARGEFFWENPAIIRVTAKDGTILWTEQRLHPIFDKRGRIVEILGVASDITRQIFAEKQLRKSEEALKAFLNAIPETAALMDLKGRFVTINEAGAHRMKQSVRSLIGRSMFDLLPKEIAKTRRQAFRKVARTGKAQRFRELFDGREIAYIVYPVPGEKGTVEHLAVIGMDITEKNRIETAFQEKKEQLELALEAANLGIWDADLQAGNEFCCDRWTGMLGYSLDEVVQRGIQWTDLTHPDDLARIREETSRSLDGEDQCYRSEFRMKSADGTWKWIYSAGRVVEWDDEGRPLRMTGIHMDIDERRRVDDALKEREKYLSAIFNAAKDVSFVTLDAGSTDFRILDFSPGSERLFGYDRAEVVNEPVALMHTQKDASRLSDIFRTIMENGEEYSGEMTVVKKDGSHFPALCTIYPLFDDNKTMRTALHITVDLTEIKNAERAASESEKRYQTLVEGCPDPIFLFRGDDLTYANKAALRLLGAQNAEEITGHSILAPFCGDAEELCRDTVDLTEVEIERLDGGSITIEAIGVPVEFGTDVEYMVIGRDISRRKEAEDALRESEGRYRSLVELSPEAIMVHCEGKLVYSNSAGLEMLVARKLSDVVGRSLFDFLVPELHEEEENFIRADLQELRQPRIVERQIRRADGEIIDVETTAAPVMYKGKQAVQFIARDITARRKAEDQIQFWHKQLTISNEIIKVANSSLILDEMMERILTMTMEMLDFEVGGIFLKNPDGRTANLMISEGTPDAFGERMGTIYIHDWPYNLTFFAGQPHYVPDLPEDPPGTIDRSILDDMECRSYAGIPLIADSLVVGALYIGSRERAQFSRREQEILESIGKEIGGTVLRGMLHDQLEEAYAEASTYLDILENDLKKANDALLDYTMVVREMLKGSGESYAQKLQATIKQSSEIINNIATIRRIKDHPEEFEPVELDAVIRGEIAKHPDIDISYRDTGIIVFADSLLSEIFANIIGNSVKFGGTDVMIRIDVEEREGMVLVSVEDTGPGISEEEKHCIFSAFRLNASAAGRGLGLHVSRMLANRYCGTIEIGDRVPGKPSSGLAVRVSLPPYEYDSIEILPNDLTPEQEGVRDKRPDA
jgi:PAS domain S-box-containing protein